MSVTTREHEVATRSAVALLLASAAAADAASPDDTPDSIEEGTRLETVIVLGQRASLRSAAATKRARLEIADSVAADDILKLPDLSVSDAVQRITGVQIARDRGEGSIVTVRGLTQVEATVNGREVFTAGTGRTLDFADFPAEMVARIDVVKSASADQLEGGIGGLVDLRTRTPFDFDGPALVGLARAIRGDLIDRTRPQYSLLATSRWDTDAAGELGALINVSWQERAWREDQKGSGNPVVRSNLIPGELVTAPNGTSETTSVGSRKRLGATASLRWRPPSGGLELYAEGQYTEFRTLQDSHQINVLASPTFVPGSVELFPGTNDLERITWTGSPISILSFARDTVDRTKQVAAGGTWTSGALAVEADVSYTESFNHLFFSGLFFSGTAANFSHDLSGPLPGTGITGTDLLAPANLRYSGVAYRTRPFDGNLTAARLDARYALGGAIKTLSAGVRFARRRATNSPGLIFADAPVAGLTAADKPEFIQPNPYGDFFPDESAPSIRHFITGDLSTARDASALRSAFNITTPIPATASPLSLWNIEEETPSAYVMARFETPRRPLDGNLGVRVIRTRESLASSETTPSAGVVAPVDRVSTYTDFLPSVNLRYRLGPDLYLRAAASKTLTRPNFDQLSPSLSLLQNSTNPQLNQGSAGNPDLRPVRSKNIDLALERYFEANALISATLFRKRVDGFVTTVSSPETHDGVVYQVSRPQNNTPATIKGFELGYQQFYDFLPGWLGGFGLQANYTYIDSETPDRTLGRVPLQNLSRRSLNVIGMYERGPLSARLAYNWRDKFLSGVTTVVGVGALPVYTRDYDWLDASLSYRFGDHLSFAIEGMNLLGTMRRAYYGVPTRPQSNWVNDRQISITATARL